MSTVVVVKKEGTVAIGADTLTMFGSTRESASYVENHSKITSWGRNEFASVGHASWGLVLASCSAKFDEEPRLDSAQSIFEFSRELHRLLKEDYFLETTEDDDDPFECSQLECLIANPFGIFGLYRFRSVQAYARFYSFGSGRQFAMGAMRAVYESGLDAGEVARTGLEAAVDLDEWTGAPIEVKTMALAR